MKAGIVTMITSITLIFIMGIILVINQNYNRKNEIEESLSIAIDQSMNSLAVEKQYASGDEDTLISDLLQRIILQINSDGDINVNILKIDTEEGLLDIEVTETYKVAGKEKSVSVRRTMILDDYEKSGILDSKVLFNIDGTNHKYWIQTNDGSVYQDERIPNNYMIDFNHFVLSGIASDGENYYYKNGVKISETLLTDEDTVVYFKDDIAESKIKSIKGWYEDGSVTEGEKITGSFKITMDTMFKAITK